MNSCEICDKEFPNKSNLNRHLKMVHDDDEEHNSDASDSSEDHQNDSGTDEDDSTDTDSENDEYSIQSEKSTAWYREYILLYKTVISPALSGSYEATILQYISHLNDIFPDENHVIIQRDIIAQAIIPQLRRAYNEAWVDKTYPRKGKVYRTIHRIMSEEEISVQEATYRANYVFEELAEIMVNALITNGNEEDDDNYVNVDN